MRDICPETVLPDLIMFQRLRKSDRLDRKNWRPITLLNVDYKLCARTLAGRLLRVIHYVVEKDGETMAINIRENPRIRGIRPPGSQEELKLSQYADDTTLLLTDDQSIDEAFMTFDLYERAFGAKINKGKCKGLWCGAFVQRTDQLHDFEWFNDYIPEKILGQFIGNVDCTQLNWDIKIQKINNIVTAWRHTELSFKGRALVINGLLTSTLWYNATSLPVSSRAIAQIEQAIYNFFWNYKRHLVSKDILALPLQHGGFNIPRLRTKIQALRLNTLRRLLSDEDAHWKDFTGYFLRISHTSWKISPCT